MTLKASGEIRGFFYGSVYFDPMFLKEKEDRRSTSLLSAESSLLLMVDLQEKFIGAVTGMEDVAKRVSVLTKSAAHLQIPIVVSEQYSKGLGHTLPEILSLLPQGAPVFDKLSFSAMDVPEWTEAVRHSKRDQIVLCGVETHVCILQTALDMIQNLDAQIYVVEDAVSSRKLSDKESALHRLRADGAQLVTTEMVVCEWLRRAGTDDFKALQPLIK